MSTENEVSVMSANSIFKNLDKEKYEIIPIYISKEGKWYQYNQLEEIKIDENSNNMEEIKTEDSNKTE